MLDLSVFECTSIQYRFFLLTHFQKTEILVIIFSTMSTVPRPPNYKRKLELEKEAHGQALETIIKEREKSAQAIEGLKSLVALADVCQSSADHVGEILGTGDELLALPPVSLLPIDQAHRAMYQIYNLLTSCVIALDTAERYKEDLEALQRTSVSTVGSLLTTEGGVRLPIARCDHLLLLGRLVEPDVEDRTEEENLLQGQGQALSGVGGSSLQLERFSRPPSYSSQLPFSIN
jgi:hypothetical protein